jgi:hypothetical protein
MPCRSFPFDLHSAAVFDSHTPWHGMCESTLCVGQTRPHCVNQMGKTQSKPLAERHGNDMVCVNPPLGTLILVLRFSNFDFACSFMCVIILASHAEYRLRTIAVK